MRTLGGWMQVGDERLTWMPSNGFTRAATIRCSAAAKLTIGRYESLDVCGPLTYICGRNQFSACLATLPRPVLSLAPQNSMTRCPMFSRDRIRRAYKRKRP